MIDQIEADLKTAQRAGETDRVMVLRGLKSALQNERIKLGSDLDEPQIISVLRRESKQREEAAQAYRRGGAEERASKELAEKSIIETYLPAPMDPGKVEQLVDEAINQLGRESGQKGAIIGRVMAQANGMADGRQVAEIVNRKLG